MSAEHSPAASADGTVAATKVVWARLDELAQVCHLGRVAFHETADRFHWRPAPGSAAEHLAGLLPSPDPLLSAARPGSGHRLIWEVVQTYLLTASGHLGGLSALYLRGEVLFTPGMVVRAVIESCARAMWVLGDGRGPVSEILARGYLEELLSAEEAKKAAGRLGSKDSDQYRTTVKDWREMRAEALERFPDATLEELESGELAGQRRVRPGEAVSWMFQLLADGAGSTVTARQSQGIYDYLSSVTHPTLYPTRDLRSWGSRPDHPDEVVATLSVETGFLERQTLAAVVAQYNALAYVTSFFGWSPDVHDRLTDGIERLLPGVLRGPP